MKSCMRGIIRYFPRAHAPRQVAAVVGVSSYHPLVYPIFHAGGLALLPPPRTGINDATPVLLVHGDADQMIDQAIPELMAQILRHGGVPVSLYRFKEGHGGDPWPEPWRKADVADWMRDAVDAAVAAAAKAGGAEPAADLTAGLLVGGEVRLGLARDPAHLADPGTTVFDTDGNALGAYAALLGPRWR